MLRYLRAFLTSDAPTRAQAAWALRTLFMLAFAGQTGLALVAWGALLVFFRPDAASALTAQMLLGLAGLGLPVTLALGTFSARSGEQAGALRAALLQGILLAVPVWFAVFCWLIGSPAVYTLALLGLAALYYALGWLLVGRYAAQATLTGTQTNGSLQKTPRNASQET